MPQFPDALAAALATEGMMFPDGFGDALTAAYTADIDETTNNLNTTIGLRDERIRELMATAAIDAIPDEAADTLDPDEPVEADFDDFFTDEDPDKENN